MTKSHLSARSQTDTWITPKYIIDALGVFDLDPCAHTEMPWKCAEHQYTVEDDGLSKPWFGRVWVNPPFNARIRGCFMARMQSHGNGVMLIPAAFETDHFKRFVFGSAALILAMDHRPYFCRPDGTKGKSNSGQTICLAAYGNDNAESLLRSGLGTPLIELKPEMNTPEK